MSHMVEHGTIAALVRLLRHTIDQVVAGEDLGGVVASLQAARTSSIPRNV